MKYKFTALISILILFTSVFAMSGDGEKEPRIEKKEAKQKVISEKSVIETENSKSNKTVIDRLGIDTDKSEKELQNFKKDYMLKFRKTIPNLTKSAGNWYFDSRIDLNKIDKFKEYGLDLMNPPPAIGASYKKNTLVSDIIVTGEAVELITKGEDFTPRYKLKIEEVIVGTEVIEKFLEEIPEYLYYIAFLGVSIDKESILNKKGIYFLVVDPYTKVDSLFRKRPFSTVMIYNDSIVCYERTIGMFNQAFINIHERSHTKKMQNEIEKEKMYKIYNNGYIKESWEEIIANIYKILEINDSDNFYRREYR